MILKIRRLIDSANYQVSEGPRWFADPENLIVDFDWRFQKDTAERLFGMLARFGRVACIGAPTVFSLLSKVRRTDILIDQNPTISTRLVVRRGGSIAVQSKILIHLTQEVSSRQRCWTLLGACRLENAG